MDVDGLLLEDRIDDAKRRWLAARAELVKAPSFASSERLFFLSLLVVPSCEPREARAVLETGVELLSDEGHRHILRCLLAREAVGGGDPDAAEAWLAACHPRPLELRMDSAYRLATAALATARSDHQGVLTILGEDTPLAADFALDCAVLRIHGLDAVGREERAVTELEELEGRMGADAVYRAIRTGVPMGLCFRVRRAALRRRKEWWLAETEKVIHPPELQGQSFLRRLGSALRFFLVFSAVFSAAASGLAIFLAAVAFEHSSNETIYRLLTVAVSAGPCLALALFVFAVVGRIRQRAAARERRAVLKREIEELTSREARDR
ncbi:MAG TPA: hypothetical protein RMH99_15035 [Sandaracinaceae bacterium LLY-WYZ-13_1]|nr:hypothetical protein [Sandaracinaceae bacterium LLY-WYZ-13_1]